uniref:LIM zinc-binding domain-containing protein n=1 Tax=Heterorhabditis bacteriophora TaxID=37862 RepID=A0A1I7WSF3_HETBA
MNKIFYQFNCRKYRRTCDKCRILLETDDVVMRARDAVFHVHCFSCFILVLYPHILLFLVHYDTPLIPRGDETLLSMKRKEDSDEHDGEISYSLSFE